MPSKKELTLELSALQSLIDAQTLRMKFLADLRKQPALLHTLTMLHHHHPELIQQIKQLQQWYGLSVTNAMNYLQSSVMPSELSDLTTQKHRLESELKLLEIEPQQQPEAETENPPDAESRPLETAGSAPVGPPECTPSDGDGDAGEQEGNAEIAADLNQQAEEDTEDMLLNTFLMSSQSDAADDMENEDLHAVSQGDDHREESHGGSADGSDGHGPHAQEFIPTLVGAPAPPPDYLA